MPAHDPDYQQPALNRRKFMANSAAVSSLVDITSDPWSAHAADLAPVPASRQASGIKIGEVTDTTAIVWARRTAQATRNSTGKMYVGHIRRNDELPDVGDPNQLAGACPGAAGRIRVRYGTT